MLTEVRDDLWETEVFSPFPGLLTHAYLWTGGPNGNVLFYSTGTDADFAEIQERGGIGAQYLSHQDEAGPQLAAIADRFGSRLHAPGAEAEQIGGFHRPDVLWTERHVDANDVEVIPTPGHTPGSTCFVVTGAGGARYLFTGDTMFRGDDGRWAAGFIPPMSDATALAQTLELLATLSPDVVVTSAAPDGTGVHELDGVRWEDCVDQAADGLPG